MYKDVHTYRIAMLVADLGTMHDTFQGWFEQSEEKRQECEEAGEDDHFDFMRKSLVLDCFAALATACKFMVDRNMIHNDLKPRNILLTLDDSDRLREFSHKKDEKGTWEVKPVITDFGLAQPIHSSNFRNPNDVVGNRTHGFVAPEQVLNRAAGQPKSRKSIIAGQLVDERAMVFQLGATMFWLMHPAQEYKRDKSAPRQFQEPESPVDESEPALDARNYKDLYTEVFADPIDDRELIKRHFTARKSLRVTRSKGLTRLITSCLRWSPDDRPLFAELIQDIQMERQLHYQRQIPGYIEGMQLEVLAKFQLGQAF